MQIEYLSSLLLGAAMVAIYSWSRFDEPSYDSQSEYFARYKPRFATSQTRYARAKLGYLFAIILLFLALSLVPGLYKELAGFDANTSGPLIAALAIIALQNFPVLRNLEQKIRGFLHTLARIPDSVRRTVQQMRSSPFMMASRSIACQTRNLLTQIDCGMQDSARLNNLILEDDLLHAWFSVGCLLAVVRDSNENRTGIDPLFFDYYKDELDGITARHSALSDAARKRLSAYLVSTSTSVTTLTHDNDDSTVMREVCNLRDRLYTFVACGVHSSVKNDAASLEIVRRLGFSIIPINSAGRRIGSLVGFAFIALLILSGVTVFSIESFRTNVLLQAVGKDLFDVFGVPKETPDMFIWSWFAAAFYFAAILGALVVRDARVGS